MKSMFTVPIFLFLILLIGPSQEENLRYVKEVHISVGTDVINEVEPYFLSYCMDSYVFDPEIRWLKFNFSSVKLHVLLKSLSPAYFRVGGYPADYLFFNVPYDRINRSRVDSAAVVMTKEDVKNMVELTRSTNSRLLFDLNFQVRFGKKWDPTNAIQLMEFMSQNGYGENVDWELGNEPSYWASGVATPEQLGKDYRILHNLIQQYPLMSKSVLVGPDIISVDKNGLVYLQAVANYSGDIVKAVTFHHYYLRGDKATFETYLDPGLFENLDKAIDMVKDTLAESTHPTLPIWIGETSDGWNGGTPNVSDRFVSGFLWMDKLGLSAKRGIKVVMRQTIYGHNYPLLDDDMNPNPDFWLSWLHKKLVGQKVFNVDHDAQDSSTRIYSHCTSENSLYKAGSLTVYALNVDPSNSVSLKFGGSLGEQRLHVYLVEPDVVDYDYLVTIKVPVLSKWSKVNGKRMEIRSNTSMPDLEPLELKPGNPVLLPPLTYAFFVFPDSNIRSCL